MSKDFEEKVLKKLSGLDEIKEKVSKIDMIEEKVTRIEEKLENINKSVILIEDKISNDIPALFDAYSSNHQKQEKDEEKIHSLEKTNFNHSVRISNLEIAVDKHSKQIKNLIS